MPLFSPIHSPRYPEWKKYTRNHLSFLFQHYYPGPLLSTSDSHHTPPCRHSCMPLFIQTALHITILLPTPSPLQSTRMLCMGTARFKYPRSMKIKHVDYVCQDLPLHSLISIGRYEQMFWPNKTEILMHVIYIALC